jgi:orotate phosphoribosyltransferase
MSYQDDLVRLLVDAGALRFGDFTLKSGAKSPFFVNLGDVATGDQLAGLGAIMARALEEHFPLCNHLFGPAYKGIVMASAIAQASSIELQKDLPFLYDRKERKAHGEGGSYIGRRPTDGDRVVIIDDVYSSGGTKVEAAQKLKDDFGIEAIGILVVVDRRPRGVALDPALPPMASIVDLPFLVDWLARNDPDHFGSVLRFYEEGA